MKKLEIKFYQNGTYEDTNSMIYGFPQFEDIYLEAKDYPPFVHPDNYEYGKSYPIGVSWELMGISDEGIKAFRKKGKIVSYGTEYEINFWYFYHKDGIELIHLESEIHYDEY